MNPFELYQEALSQGKEMTVRLLYFDEKSIASDPSLLLLERASSQQLAGQLEPPGGRLEAGELPEKGLVRETMEETGLALTGDCLQFLFHLDFKVGQDRSVREIFFMATGPRLRIQTRPSEHCRSLWIPLNQLAKHPLHPKIQSFLIEKEPWIKQLLTMR